MSPWRQYLTDLSNMARHLGGFAGILMFLLAVSGVIVPLSGDSGWVEQPPWLIAGVGVPSALLCALAVALIFFSLRTSLYFALLARLRRYRRRRKRGGGATAPR